MVKLIGGSYHGNVYDNLRDRGSMRPFLRFPKQISLDIIDLNTDPEGICGVEEEIYTLRVCSLPGDLHKTDYYAEESLTDEFSFEMLKELLNNACN